MLFMSLVYWALLVESLYITVFCFLLSIFPASSSLNCSSKSWSSYLLLLVFVTGMILLLLALLPSASAFITLKSGLSWLVLVVLIYFLFLEHAINLISGVWDESESTDLIEILSAVNYSLEFLLLLVLSLFFISITLSYSSKSGPSRFL